MVITIHVILKDFILFYVNQVGNNWKIFTLYTVILGINIKNFPNIV